MGCLSLWVQSVIDPAIDAVIDSVLFRERLTFANRVLGAGVGYARIVALEPKASVSIFPLPE